MGYYGSYKQSQNGNKDDDRSCMNSFAECLSTLGGIETVKNNYLNKWWHAMRVKSKSPSIVFPCAKSDSSTLAGVGCGSDVAGAAEGFQMFIANINYCFPANTPFDCFTFFMQ